MRNTRNENCDVHLNKTEEIWKVSIFSIFIIKKFEYIFFFFFFALKLLDFFSDVQTPRNSSGRPDRGGGFKSEDDAE